MFHIMSCCCVLQVGVYMLAFLHPIPPPLWLCRALRHVLPVFSHHPCLLSACSPPNVIARIIPPLGCTASGCLQGYQLAAGTVYDSWPYPHSPEADNYNGVTYSGMFASVFPSDTCNGAGEVKVTKGVCSPASLCTPDNYTNDCRFRDAIVAKFKMASVFPASLGGNMLAGKKLRVHLPTNRTWTILVNALDTCADKDCGGCCTANKHFKTGILLDLEKHAAKALYGVSDVFNTITYSSSGVASFTNPTGKLYDLSQGSAMSGELCFQVVNDTPAIKDGVPTDDNGIAITTV